MIRRKRKNRMLISKNPASKIRTLALNYTAMITKEKLIKHIEKFPDEMSIDELIDRLVFVEKLENRISQSINGETITDDELKTEMGKWFV